MREAEKMDCPYCGKGITEHRATAWTANGRDVERHDRIHANLHRNFSYVQTKKGQLK